MQAGETRTTGHHRRTADPVGQQIAYLPRVGGAQKAAYTGTGDPDLAGRSIPQGGCATEAQRRLTQGAPSVDGAVAIDIANASGERALADSRVVAVTTAWSDCMNGKGYRYPSPYEARDDPRWNPEGDDHAVRSTSGEAEIRTAVADLECRRQVNYLGVRLAVISAYQAREITARESLFAQLKIWHDQRMKNADLVLVPHQWGP